MLQYQYLIIFRLRGLWHYRCRSNIVDGHHSQWYCWSQNLARYDFYLYRFTYNACYLSVLQSKIQYVPRQFQSFQRLLVKYQPTIIYGGWEGPFQTDTYKRGMGNEEMGNGETRQWRNELKWLSFVDISGLVAATVWIKRLWSSG